MSKSVAIVDGGATASCKKSLNGDHKTLVRSETTRDSITIESITSRNDSSSKVEQVGQILSCGSADGVSGYFLDSSSNINNNSFD